MAVFQRLVGNQCHLHVIALSGHLVELDVPVGRDLGLGVVLGRGFGNLVGGPRSKLGEKPLGSVVEFI